MNQPVPVSTNGIGRTVTVPRPQFSVTSPRTSAVTSATAGLASRMASCTLRADVAAGAETIHALEHLRAMGAVASTRENLVTAASGEVQEIDVTLPRMIREAEEDGRSDAAASFRLALERERHHRDMFRHALATFDGAAATSAVPLPSAPAAPTSPAPLPSTPA